MFESSRYPGAPAAPSPWDRPAHPCLGTEALVGLVRRLSDMRPAGDDAARIDRIAALEALKGAAAAAQARESAAFNASHRAAQEARGLARDLVGRGVAEQIALARRESPHQGSRLLGLALALVEEMPRTLAALAAGETSEWRATVMVRETACLSIEDRARVDAEVGPRLGGLGNGAVEREARVLAQRLDAASAVARAARAAADRRVTVRPAPDTMTFLTAHLPVVDGVAAFAALDAEARRLVAAGDDRGRGQIMADVLVARLTGRAAASRSPVEIGLVMTDLALLAGSDDPALVTGPGLTPMPVPAAVARALVADGPDSLPVPQALEAQVWLRRLYTGPDGHDLVAMDSRRRRFDGLLRRMVVTRDQSCRTPHCDAPIRHSDHVRPVRSDGPTSLANAAGLCERCNQVKEMPGWTTAVVASSAEAPHRTTTTTPTGHRYHSAAPPLLPGMLPRVRPGAAGRAAVETGRLPATGPPDRGAEVPRAG